MTLPYTLADLIALKPGCMIHGLVISPDNGFMLGPAWVQTRGGFTPRGGVPVTVLLEGRLQLRTSLQLQTTQRWFSSGVVVTRVEGDALSHHLSEAGTGRDRPTQCIKFMPGKPLGMFLGHILRSDTRTWVNLLTLQGLDIWI